MLSAQFSKTGSCVAHKKSRTLITSKAAAGGERKYGMWHPAAVAPEWLDNTLPGDFGFDPFGLYISEWSRAWFVEAEKIHGRWCMLATAGILAQEITGAGDCAWWDVGTQESEIPLQAHFAIEMIAMGAVENLRLQGYKNGQTGPVDFMKSGDNYEMQTKEIKNGRLAMLSLMGYFFQALICREAPLSGLNKHLLDPFNYNIWSNMANMQDLYNDLYPQFNQFGPGA